MGYRLSDHAPAYALLIVAFAAAFVLIVLLACVF